MGWLLGREAVVALAVLGAAASMLASLLQGNGKLSPANARKLNIAGYVFMTVSMILFIVAGFRAGFA